MTYANAVLECEAAHGERLEELGNGRAVGLRIGGGPSGGGLRRREVGDALCGLVFDVWNRPRHCAESMGSRGSIGNVDDFQSCRNWEMDKDIRIHRWQMGPPA